MITHRLWLPAVAAPLLLASTPNSHASDIKHAQQLHDSQCLRCHQPDFYQRENRKVKTLSRLHAAVETCNTDLATGWFPEDVTAVSNYLNEKFYKLKN